MTKTNSAANRPTHRVYAVTRTGALGACRNGLARVLYEVGLNDQWGCHDESRL
jgi:hypothetical protein